MLLNIKNPVVNIESAKRVYVVYLWINPKTGEPESDLCLMVRDPDQTIAELIKEIQARPDVTFRGLNAKLQDIYVDNQSALVSKILKEIEEEKNKRDAQTRAMWDMDY